jgi:hypothetical protein
MYCAPTICTALLLISLTAGMWLLYKTRKETLGTFFKVVAWFIIVLSIASMIHCAAHCVMSRCCARGNACGGTEQCDPGGAMNCKDGGQGAMSGCCKEGKECGEDAGACAEAKEGCCKDGKGGEHEAEATADTAVSKH